MTPLNISQEEIFCVQGDDLGAIRYLWMGLFSRDFYNLRCILLGKNVYVWNSVKF